MRLPLISVVIPSFNKVGYIADTLDSILNQKYPNLELIIQDGGSDDGTVEIIKKYAKKYAQIITWESQKDNGQVDAINKGLKKSKGKIVTFINADDIYVKGSLVKVGKFFLKNPETLWLVGRGKVINDKGKEVYTTVTRYKNSLLKANKYWLLQTLNYFIQPSVFLSREAYKKYGPFKGTSKFVMEYDLWLKIGKIKMPEVLLVTLSCFRLSQEGLSLNISKEILRNDFEITQKHVDNKIILVLHKLHNLGRIGTAYLNKFIK